MEGFRFKEHGSGDGEGLGAGSVTMQEGGRVMVQEGVEILSCAPGRQGGDSYRK